jgi:hypothetical protein
LASLERLAGQAPLDREDAGASFPHADVFGRGVATSAEVADYADQSPLVVNCPLPARDQLHHELVIAGDNGKGRARLASQRLIQKDNIIDADYARHGAQQLRVRLSRVVASHRAQASSRPGSTTTGTYNSR